jgi:transcriptional regulator with XRE-family HTH domain
MTLQALRLSKGLTLKQASTISGVSIYHIKKLERGQWRKTAVTTVIKLMDLLDLKFAEFEKVVEESARIQRETKVQE